MNSLTARVLEGLRAVLSLWVFRKYIQVLFTVGILSIYVQLENYLEKMLKISFNLILIRYLVDEVENDEEFEAYEEFLRSTGQV